MLGWYKRVVVPRLLNSEMGSARIEEIRKEVIAVVSGEVLEIGVGPGYNIPLYRGVTKLYALEPSNELLAIARYRAADASFPIEYLNCGAESIPLPNSSVDTVVSTWTMCSVGDPAQVLREISRVLRPRGRFVFVDHGASPRPIRYWAQRITTVVTKHFTGNCHYDRKIGELIRGAGFSIISTDHPWESGSPLIYNYRGTAVRASENRA